MFEQAFKNIADILWKEAGCTTELDYTEQTSWLLFLKYIDDLEQDRAMEAELAGQKYTYILDKPYRWESWAAPKGKDGKLDHNKALTGDDLLDFVNQKLFRYLQGFKQKASGPNTIEYKIGEIKNKISSGYNLREIIDHIDELRFRSQTEKYELSHLYEAKIKRGRCSLDSETIGRGDVVHFIQQFTVKPPEMQSLSLVNGLNMDSERISRSLLRGMRANYNNRHLPLIFYVRGDVVHFIQ